MKVWTGHAERPRLRSLLVRNRHALRSLQVLEISCTVLVIAISSSILISIESGDQTTPSNDAEIARMNAIILENNAQAERDPRHVTLVYPYVNSKELPSVIQAQEASIDAAIPIQVIIEKKRSTVRD